MKSALQRYATPLTAGLFLVALVSGVALFFHVTPSVFHSMHEWLSMLLIAPFALHLWRNWPAMTKYFARPAFVGSIAACSAAALAFALLSAGVGERRGVAQFALVDALTTATPAKLAPALGTDAETLVSTLKARGFATAVVDLPLTRIAADSGKGAGELASALVAATR